MNFEGTKHEKAVLVVIAFIIGFTCGFIAFGVSRHNDGDDRYENHTMMWQDKNVTPDGMPYTAPAGNPPDTQASEEPAPEATEPVSYEDGKLFAQVGEDRYVLSIRSDEVVNTNVQGFSTQGIHEALPAYQASPDGKYIYFCEQQTKDAECTNLIFDTTNRVIQFVSSEGKKLITPDSDATTAQWDGSTLIIGSFRSANVDTPWKVALAQ